MKIKVFDKTGKNKEEVDFSIADVEVNSEILAQYIRVYNTNQRQGTADTKNRREVRGGGKKPWKQKGTGRARSGSIRSPLWVGGGVVHGPSPKDWGLKLGTKIRQKALSQAIALKKDNISAFEFGSGNSVISTKMASGLIKTLGDKKSVLVLHGGSDVIFKSFRNLQYVNVVTTAELNVIDLLNADVVLVEKSAISLLQARIK